MDYKDLCDSIQEAERFLEKAKEAKTKSIRSGGVNSLWWTCIDGKANAACLRASMDLTRCLANLRHPWRKK